MVKDSLIPPKSVLIFFYIDLLLLSSEHYETVKAYSKETFISAESFKLPVIILHFLILSLAEKEIMLINIFCDIYSCSLPKDIIMSIGEYYGKKSKLFPYLLSLQIETSHGMNVIPSRTITTHIVYHQYFSFRKYLFFFLQVKYISTGH